MFNHESQRRGETFVTRKITRGLSFIAVGIQKCLLMGNLNSLRDWGHAKDYVYMQWLMLQQKKPEDFVIATGRQYSVREFIKWAGEDLGIEITFHGSELNEVGIVSKINNSQIVDVKVGDVIVRIDARYFRPTEVDTLLGDATKAKLKLGWTPSTSARELCSEMISSDYQEAIKFKFYQLSIKS